MLKMSFRNTWADQISAVLPILLSSDTPDEDDDEDLEVDPDLDVDPEGDDDDGPTPPDVIEQLGFDPDDELPTDADEMNEDEG